MSPSRTRVSPSASGPEQERLDQAARISQLEELLAQRDSALGALAAQNAELKENQWKTKKSKKPPLVFQYEDFEPFTYPVRKTEANRANLSQFFNDFRRITRILCGRYKANPSDETVERAKWLHNIMIEECPENEDAMEEFYKGNGNNGMMNEKDKERIRHAHGNLGKIYISFCATFKDHIEPHRPFMEELDKTRNIYNEYVPGGGLYPS